MKALTVENKETKRDAAEDEVLSPQLEGLEMGAAARPCGKNNEKAEGETKKAEKDGDAASEGEDGGKPSSAYAW